MSQTIYYLERLDEVMGLWAPLAESTERTGFHMRPVVYDSREAADAALAEHVSAAPAWRGRLRVTIGTAEGARGEEASR